LLVVVVRVEIMVVVEAVLGVYLRVFLAYLLVLLIR
jgi:hypothetical protein